MINFTKKSIKLSTILLNIDDNMMKIIILVKYQRILDIFRNIINILPDFFSKALFFSIVLCGNDGWSSSCDLWSSSSVLCDKSSSWLCKPRGTGKAENTKYSSFLFHVSKPVDIFDECSYICYKYIQIQIWMNWERDSLQILQISQI